MRIREERRFKRAFKGAVYFDRLLKDHTTFKIGGAVRVWIEPRSADDLKRALEICYEAGIKPFLIGRGSNLLVFDGRVDRAVIRLSAPCFKKVKFSGSYATCGGGGPERFAGIPGTVGGAVMMNAGTARDGICDLLAWIKVIDRRGRASVITREGLKLGYRDSGLSGSIILEAAFKLKKRERKALRREFKGRFKEKVKRQDYTAPNAGSIFKNPKGYKYTSGQMLEMSGLKGLRVGGAEISNKHANFIINTDGATFADVRTLMRKAKRAVKKNFGVSLQTEVKILK